MKNMNKNKHFDPNIAELLDQLTETPERDPELAEQNFTKFLSELEKLPIPQKRPARLSKALSFFGNQSGKHKKENLNIMSNSGKRVAITIGVVVVIALIFLFGGSAATVLASRNAIPGDTLYPLKTTFENTRLSITSDAETRVDLHLQYAEQRLVEIESLIAEGRLNRIDPATRAFENHIKNALDEVKNVAEQDSIRASYLMARIMDSLTRYAGTLTRISEYIPEPLLNDIFDIVKFDGAGGENFNESFDVNENIDFLENLNSDSNLNNNNWNDNSSFDDNYNDQPDFNYNDNISNSSPTKAPVPSYNTNTNTSTNSNTNWNSNSNDND